MHLLSASALMTALLLSACKPVKVIEHESSIEEEQPDQLFQQDPDDIVEATESTQTYAGSPSKRYMVLTDPWSKYFRSEPVVFLLPSMSKGVARLLREQQTLAKEILSSNGDFADRPEFLELARELDLLKSAIPGAVTRSGYRQHRYYSSSRAYVSPDGTFASARSGRRGYYTTFKNVHKSSSPALARSIEGIVYNASVEDLDQRIAALQQLIRVWSRRTGTLSPNGFEGIMREANMAYLDSLKDYLQDWVKLHGRRQHVENLVETEVTRREERLSQWQSFEVNRLPAIANYVERNHAFKAPTHDGSLSLPEAHADHPVVLIACRMGERTLFFDLSDGPSSDHPFRLVALDD